VSNRADILEKQVRGSNDSSVHYVASTSVASNSGMAAPLSQSAKQIFLVTALAIVSLFSLPHVSKLSKSWTGT